MSGSDQTNMVIKTFNTIASKYDCNSLRFFDISAENTLKLLNPDKSDNVLDVACGTGKVALLMAKNVRKVTAVDFSDEMLKIARAKAERKSIGNIDFLQMDMQNLDLPDNSFDSAVCAFGIFFVEDVFKQLKEITKKVKPGGKILITTFYESYMSPLKDIYISDAREYGAEPPVRSSMNVNTKHKCTELMKSAGLKNITLESINCGYYLEDPSQWWDIIYNAGYRSLYEQIADNLKAEFKEKHLSKINELSTEKGIKLDVDVLYSIGEKQ